MVKLDDVRPVDWNPRTISEYQLRALQESLSTFGAVEPIVINKDGTLIGGHQRWAAARELGWASLPAVRLDLDDTKVRTLNLALNKISGEWDEDALARVLASITVDPVEILEAGFEEDEVARLMASLNVFPPTDDPGPGDLPAAPETKMGDLYTLGEHRLLCGDATMDDDVARVLAGDTIDVVWTDPPYGVGYHEGMTLEEAERRNQRKDGKQVPGDDLKAGALRAMLETAFGLALQHQRNGGAWFVCAPSGPETLTFAEVVGGLDLWRSSIVWVKDQFAFGRTDYHYRHEMLYYGWKPGARHRWYGGRAQDSVWEIDRPKRSESHPTMKPVELVTRSLGHVTRRGHVVYEPFAGAGSTLIACQEMARAFRGMEIDPGYCDVIVQRWETMTGEKASRERGGR